MKTSCVQPKTQFIHGSKKYVKLLKSITLTLSDGNQIIIPEGFIYDQSSVPQFLWAIFPPFGDFNLASLIHDYLYVTDYKRKELGDYEARLFTDREMLKWSNRYNNQTRWDYIDNRIRYYAVRAFGIWNFKRWGDQRVIKLKQKNAELISRPK